MNGLIRSRSLEWVAYNPSTGKHYHRDLDASSAEKAMNGIFYQPKLEEIEYMAKLSKCWRSTEKGKNQAGAPATKSCPKRQHQLIGQTDVGVFFDATVEVSRTLRFYFSF